MRPTQSVGRQEVLPTIAMQAGNINNAIVSCVLQFLYYMNTSNEHGISDAIKNENGAASDKKY